MRWVMFVPLLVLLVLFALSNMQEVELRLWPLDFAWATPLSIAVLLIAAVGFLMGAVIAWSAALGHRRRLAQMTRSARLLEAELATLKAREAEWQRGTGGGIPLGRLPSAPR